MGELKKIGRILGWMAVFFAWLFVAVGASIVCITAGYPHYGVACWIVCAFAARPIYRWFKNLETLY